MTYSLSTEENSSLSPQMSSGSTGKCIFLLSGPMEMPSSREVLSDHSNYGPSLLASASYTFDLVSQGSAPCFLHQIASSCIIPPPIMYVCAR